MKYVVSDQNCFAIFDDVSSHRDMARAIYGKAVGAGFCNMKIGYRPVGHDLDREQRFISVHCYGRSDTLDLESREEDEVIINEKINSNY